MLQLLIEPSTDEASLIYWQGVVGYSRSFSKSLATHEINFHHNFNFDLHTRKVGMQSACDAQRQPHRPALCHRVRAPPRRGMFRPRFAQNHTL